MTRDDLIKAITHAVLEYAKAPEFFDANPQLRINPASLEVTAVNGNDYYEEIEDSDEVVENEAAADGAENEEAEDFQAAQNPDFYALKRYVHTDSEGKLTPDEKAIEKLATEYLAK